jgi:endogenous inhibitor of DNA gyrase (YacG/DUF329 family)
MSDLLQDQLLRDRELEDRVVIQDDGKVPCPDCGLRYTAGTGLGVHRKRTHGISARRASKRPLRDCPECGKTYPSKDMARHLRTHGIVRGRGRPPKYPKQQPLSEVDADDIFATVVSIIWPDGNVPVASVMALVQWREATQRMLTEVRNGRPDR